MFIWLTVLALACIILTWILRQLRVDNYSNKYVFITGCDTGFGNLLVKKLDGLGFNVIAGCFTEKGETELAKPCSKKLMTLHLDVTNEVDISKAKEYTERHLPAGTGLWALVNNAGIVGRFGPIEWLTKDDFNDVLSINLGGVINVTKAFLPLLRRGNGRLVNMSSVAGRLAIVVGPYNVSKFAVEAFSDSLRHELYSTRVSVHVIEPGFFATPLVTFFTEDNNRRQLRQMYTSLPEETKQFYKDDFIEEMVARTQKLRQMADTDVHKVVNVYVDAVTARFPKSRYVVGKDANIIFRFMWNLPDWLCDFMLSKM